MSRRRLTDGLFWVIAGVSALLLIFLVLIVGGAIPIDSTSAPSDPAPEEIVQPAATEPTESTTATTERATTAPAATTQRTVAPTVVVLTAVRGDSWFSARVGSEDGRVLDERVLAQGESVRLQARRIWLSVGAAGNVDVTVDGKPRELAPGTVSLVLTPSI